MKVIKCVYAHRGVMDVAPGSDYIHHDLDVHGPDGGMMIIIILICINGEHQDQYCSQHEKNHQRSNWPVLHSLPWEEMSFHQFPQNQTKSQPHPRSSCSPNKPDDDYIDHHHNCDEPDDDHIDHHHNCDYLVMWIVLKIVVVQMLVGDPDHLFNVTR